MKIINIFVIYLFAFLLFTTQIALADDLKPEDQVMSPEDLKLFINECTTESTILAARACGELGDDYAKRKNDILAVFYWDSAAILFKKNEKKLNEEEKNNANRVARNIAITFVHNTDSSAKTKMCLAMEMLPWSFYSDIISNKTNTIDQNIEATIGNYKSVISRANVNLGIQVDYSLQTFVNSIRRLYNNGSRQHILSLMYLLGQSDKPNNTSEGMITVLRSISSWSFTENLFKNRRNPMPQYGTAIQIIDLMKENKIKNALLKDIIAYFLQGDTAKASILLLNQDIVSQAEVEYKKISRDVCGLPD